MIFFNHRKKLGELYKQWTIDNHVLDCPSSVVSFLQIKGLLNEEKVRDYLAVKTSSIIDGKGNSSIIFKEETNMANNEVKDLEKVETEIVEQKTEEPKKEFFIKRWAKKAWRGACKVGRAVKESPATHLVMTGVGVAGTLVVEEVIRRKFQKDPELEEEYQEPIEIEDGGEETIDEPTENEDEETEEV